MEAISLKCPNCGAVLTVPDIYIGRTSKCGRCRQVVSITPPREESPDRAKRDMRYVDWPNFLLNVALATLLIVLLGILASYLI